ncbi:unnamed protein product [Tuber aestivum]|uniref:DUF3752 domain-containing protein n=1 Tax=Tuber aestivum TaxID=59557 RepID=A0A292PWT7_9PEZI|nr:unnamed protein product [Tuber aestivum]
MGGTVGPSIPPHILAKRKLDEDEGNSRAPSGVGPSMPDELDIKKRRAVGPVLPLIDERPSSGPEEGDDETSSDDDIGPALPPSSASAAPTGAQEEVELAARRRLAQFAETKVQDSGGGKAKRDEWMLVPPKSEDWATKVDPTKLRNRKFQTGKGSKAPQKPGGDNTLWTESPEEKRKRLNDEVMGIRKPETQTQEKEGKHGVGAAEAEETTRRIREYNEKNRSQTLYEEHKKLGPREKEDDPSARAFDREKDIAGGRRIGHAQKKEMLNRAAEFGSRFSSGSFL